VRTLDVDVVDRTIQYHLLHLLHDVVAVGGKHRHPGPHGRSRSERQRLALDGFAIAVGAETGDALYRHVQDRADAFYYLHRNAIILEARLVPPVRRSRLRRPNLEADAF
jgi:hypothetical protein